MSDEDNDKYCTICGEIVYKHEGSWMHEGGGRVCSFIAKRIVALENKLVSASRALVCRNHEFHANVRNGIEESHDQCMVCKGGYEVMNE